MVTLTIDGVEVTVERGTSILNAARQAGIRIPTLCHDERLIPYGACRLCMVEVTARGRTRTMPACFNPARDGMEVATHTPKLIEARRIQLQLLLRSHPLQCPSCDAGGNCTLQELVHEYEVPELPFERESRYFHIDNTSHFIRFNMNLCIKCGMCVRICDEVQGRNELSFVNRGMESEVSTDFGRPLDCEFCGQCAQVCPVGAISSKWLVGSGRWFELKKTETPCAYCSLGCVLTLGEKSDLIVWVSSPAESHNQGNLCVKGRYGWPYIYSDQRLTKPLIKRDGILQEVDWNEALGFVADKLTKIKESSEGGALAALGSERLTNEEAYVFGRFARCVMETPHLDHAGGYGYKSAVDALLPALGYPAGTNAITEIRHADVMLLIGADLTESHPVAKNEVVMACRQKRGAVIVVDSIKTKLTGERGTPLIGRPGCEHLIVNAMTKEIIDNDFFDAKALDLRAEGFEELKASLEAYTPDAVAEMTGVDASAVRAAARQYAEAENAVICLTEGMNKPGREPVLAAQAAVNLALVVGRIGKEKNGVFLFGEKANYQGAIDMGLTPGMLPGFKPVDDEEARKEFEEEWECSLPSEPGLAADAILKKAAGGEIKGLYIVGENPVETYPGRSDVETALDNLDFLVVQDMFMTPTAKKADAVLPAVTFAEKMGTFTSAERLVQRLKPTMVRAGAKSDLEIFCALAALMGKPAMTYASPQAVFDEIGRHVPVYAGITYDKIADRGVHWPCVDEEDPGKPVLYEGGFPGGKAKLIPAPPLEKPAEGDLPYRLIPGVLKFHSGSFSQWSSSLMEVHGDGVAEMNREDMGKLGVAEGETVRITSDEGASVTAKVKSSPRALPGSIVAPYHFSTLRLNELTGRDAYWVNVKVEKA